jgi:Icc-related predicted phosphoesterase
MKILAFTDSHGSNSALSKIKKSALKNKVDLIVCAGDISIFEQGIEKIVEKIDSFNIPVLLIHGNHEDEEMMDHIVKQSKNITFLHKKMIKKDSVIFLGYGGGGFSVTDKEFEKVSESWESKISKDSKVILVTHQPPFKAVDEVLLDEHAGSKSIAKFIKKIKPEFCFCGHLHENFEKEEKIGKTRVVNPGPFGMIFKIS